MLMNWNKRKFLTVCVVKNRDRKGYESSALVSRLCSTTLFKARKNEMKRTKNKSCKKLNWHY